MNDVSIIIVNYNTSEILKECLNNLYTIYSDFEIIVVDNNSPDDSVLMVRSNFPQVKLIENKENAGLAKASNQGYKLATKRFILYLGTDAFPEKDTISGMVEYFKQYSQVGAATPKLVTRDGNYDMDAHRGFPTPWAAITHFSSLNKVFPKSRLFNQYFIGWEDLNKPHEIDLCISHFMLIKRSVIEKIGLWDEDYFVYGEDVDYCYRIKQAGWKIMYLPQWQATHYKGVSVGVRRETKDITKAPAEVRKKMRVSTTHAMKLFYDKHYKGKYNAIVTNIVILGISFLGRVRQLRS
ncbi:MAG: glycosyltransferase family 2 protein [Patescibacteria group bacterium]